MLTPPKEIAIVGDDVQELLEVVFGKYRPNQVVAVIRVEGDSVNPLFQRRATRNDKATAYVCGSAAMSTSHFSCAEGAKNRTPNFACQMPMTNVDALAAQLNG